MRGHLILIQHLLLVIIFLRIRSHFLWNKEIKYCFMIIYRSWVHEHGFICLWVAIDLLYSSWLWNWDSVTYFTLVWHSGSSSHRCQSSFSLHLDIDCHLVLEKFIHLQHVSTKLQLVDMFTNLHRNLDFTISYSSWVSLIYIKLQL